MGRGIPAEVLPRKFNLHKLNSNEPVYSDGTYETVNNYYGSDNIETNAFSYVINLYIKLLN